MTHTVAVGEFEGPLGILLELVEKGRLEVTAISVAEITAGYLGRVKAMGGQSPEALSEFLQLGARLLYIKSLALLPQDSAIEQGEELRLLNLELEEYRRIQTVARELGRRTHQRTWHRQVIEHLDPEDLPKPNLELRELANAFTRALKRVEPAPSRLVLHRYVSLEQAALGLRGRLQTGQLDLGEVIDACRDRIEIIVTFLAVLELIRDGTASVIQNGQFAPMILEAAHA